jgi:ornithine cyclodeaminase/alanine dehydrogenase
VLGIPVGSGGFHVKAAALRLGRFYFAAKLNANFPANPQRNGLPTIQGVVALSDAENGRLLALLDSGELTVPARAPPRPSPRSTRAPESLC